jgi:hypothetical protein
MRRKDELRVDLDDNSLTPDRRTNQHKGEIDVAELDAEDIQSLRDEDITNLNENELDRISAEMGVTRGTEEGAEVVPERALHKDLDRENDVVEGEAAESVRRGIHTTRK